MALVRSALVFPMRLRAVHMGAISFFSMSVGSSSSFGPPPSPSVVTRTTCRSDDLLVRQVGQLQKHTRPLVQALPNPVEPGHNSPEVPEAQIQKRVGPRVCGVYAQVPAGSARQPPAVWAKFAASRRASSLGPPLAALVGQGGGADAFQRRGVADGETSHGIEALGKLLDRSGLIGIKLEIGSARFQRQ